MLVLALYPLAGCGGGSGGSGSTTSQPITVTSPDLGCDVVETPPASGTDTWLTGFQLVGQSQDVPVAQGYSSCGNGNYFFDTSTLILSSSYDQIHALVTNADVLVPGANHMGAGDAYDGKVYTVVENWAGCATPPTVAAIRVFDAASLQPLQTQDITTDQHEVSGIAVLPGTGTAVVSSFCDSSKLFVYNLASLTLSGTMPLSTPVPNIQGLAYHAGFLYLANTDGKLYGLRLSDGTMRLLLQGAVTGEYEGLDFHSGELRWLVNLPNATNFLYLYSPQP